MGGGDDMPISSGYRIPRKLFYFRLSDQQKKDSDSFSTKERIKSKVRHGCFAPSEKRRVDFAIFVVDGILVLKSMRSEDMQYTDILVEAFNYPFMSFGDRKPAVVVTHGDQLSFSERAEVCTHDGKHASKSDG